MLVSRKLLMGGGAAPISKSFTASLEDAANGASYTFSSAAIGTAAADRTVVVIANGVQIALRQITGITIGGVSATIYENSSSSFPTAMGVLDVSSGTTADIVVTTDNNVLRMGIKVWALYGLASSTPTTAESAAGVDGISEFTLSNPSSGDAIWLAGWTADGTTAWTSPMVEDSDDLVEAAYYHSGASYQGSDASVFVEATNETNSNGLMVGGVFQ